MWHPNKLYKPVYSNKVTLQLGYGDGSAEVVPVRNPSALMDTHHRLSGSRHNQKA